LLIQEVEAGGFKDWLQPQLAKVGYTGLYEGKVNELEEMDGCATFFRSDKFELLGSHLVNFAKVAKDHPCMAVREPVPKRQIRTFEIGLRFVRSNIRISTAGFRKCTSCGAKSAIRTTLARAPSCGLRQIARRTAQARRRMRNQQQETGVQYVLMFYIMCKCMILPYLLYFFI
jgi:hypothetical protein